MSQAEVPLERIHVFYRKWVRSQLETLNTRTTAVMFRGINSLKNVGLILCRDSTAYDSTPVQPPTEPSTPADGGFVPDAPIVFDMISPSDETKHMPGDMEGPQKYVSYHFLLKLHRRVRPRSH